MLRERVLEALQQQQAKEAKAASHIPLNEEPPLSPKSGARRRHRKLSSLQQVLSLHINFSECSERLI